VPSKGADLVKLHAEKDLSTGVEHDRRARTSEAVANLSRLLKGIAGSDRRAALRIALAIAAVNDLRSRNV